MSLLRASPGQVERAQLSIGGEMISEMIEDELCLNSDLELVLKCLDQTILSETFKAALAHLTHVLNPGDYQAQQVLDSVKAVQDNKAFPAALTKTFALGRGKALLHEAKSSCFQRHFDVALSKDVDSLGVLFQSLAKDCEATPDQTIDSAMVAVSFNVKSLGRLAARLRALLGKATPQFMKNNHDRVLALTTIKDECVEKLMTSKTCGLWKQLSIEGGPVAFVQAVLSHEPLGHAAQAKVLETLKSRPFVQAIALPSVAGFSQVFDADGLAAHDKKFLAVSRVLDAVKNVVSNTEFESESLPCPANIFSDGWKELWTACEEAGFFDESMFGTILLGVLAADVDKVFAPIGLAFTTSAKAMCSASDPHKTKMNNMNNIRKHTIQQLNVVWRPPIQ
jgi:hypothetical protein